MVDKVKQQRGKRIRIQGQEFEKRVRKDLEKKGWIVDKWSNNLDYPENNINLPSKERKDFKMIQAKPKFVYNPGLKRRIMIGNSSGFPDFICFPKIWEERDLYLGEVMAHCGSMVHQTIIGVESKMTGKLDKLEKEKCKWLIKNKIFSKILIASKIKVGRKVEVEYKEGDC